MDTTLSLFQVALVLGMSMSATANLVRRKLLKRKERRNKIDFFEAQDVQEYISRQNREQAT